MTLFTLAYTVWPSSKSCRCSCSFTIAMPFAMPFRESLDSYRCSCSFTIAMPLRESLDSPVVLHGLDDAPARESSP